MHIHISDFKGLLAEKNKKMHMTTARKGRHEAKKNLNAVYSEVMNQQKRNTFKLRSTEINRIHYSVVDIAKPEQLLRKDGSNTVKKE